MTLHELPVNKQLGALTDIKNKLTFDCPSTTKQTLTRPTHEWLLPPVNLQRVPPGIPPTQRVEQRVASTHHVDTPLLQRVTEAPTIMAAPNPTARRTLELTKQTHARHTCNNTPGIIPAITRTPSTQRHSSTPILAPATAMPHQSPHTTAALVPPTCIPRVRFQRIQGGI
jgi:hypothetical protein